MNRKNLFISVLVILMATIMFAMATQYQPLNKLNSFNRTSYTLYVTSDTDTIILVRFGDKYYLNSNGTTFYISNERVVEEHIPKNSTTDVVKAYLFTPFQKCNFADPLIKGDLIVITGDTETTPINLARLFHFGCYVFQTMKGTGTLTVTITNKTLYGTIEEYRITFTLIG